MHRIGSPTLNSIQQQHSPSRIVFTQLLQGSQQIQPMFEPKLKKYRRTQSRLLDSSDELGVSSTSSKWKALTLSPAFQKQEQSKTIEDRYSQSPVSFNYHKTLLFQPPSENKNLMLANQKSTLVVKNILENRMKRRSLSMESKLTSKKKNQEEFQQVLMQNKMNRVINEQGTEHNINSSIPLVKVSESSACTIDNSVNMSQKSRQLTNNQVEKGAVTKESGGPRMISNDPLAQRSIGKTEQISQNEAGPQQAIPHVNIMPMMADMSNNRLFKERISQKNTRRSNVLKFTYVRNASLKMHKNGCFCSCCLRNSSSDYSAQLHHQLGQHTSYNRNRPAKEYSAIDNINRFIFMPTAPDLDKQMISISQWSDNQTIHSTDFVAKTSTGFMKTIPHRLPSATAALNRMSYTSTTSTTTTSAASSRNQQLKVKTIETSVRELFKQLDIEKSLRPGSKGISADSGCIRVSSVLK